MRTDWPNGTKHYPGGCSLSWQVTVVEWYKSRDSELAFPCRSFNSGFSRQPGHHVRIQATKLEISSRRASEQNWNLPLQSVEKLSSMKPFLDGDHQIRDRCLSWQSGMNLISRSDCIKLLSWEGWSHPLWQARIHFKNIWSVSMKEAYYIFGIPLDGIGGLKEEASCIFSCTG